MSGSAQHAGVLRTHGPAAGRRDGTTDYDRVTEDAVSRLLESARVLLGGVVGRQQAELAQRAGPCRSAGGGSRRRLAAHREEPPTVDTSSLRPPRSPASAVAATATHARNAADARKPAAASTGLRPVPAATS